MAKKVYNGLNGGRIDPNYKGNYSVFALVEAGFTVKTVAQHCGLTPSQVMYRYRKAGLSPMDYRRGLTGMAETVIQKFDVENISDNALGQIKKYYNEVYV